MTVGSSHGGMLSTAQRRNCRQKTPRTRKRREWPDRSPSHDLGERSLDRRQPAAEQLRKSGAAHQRLVAGIGRHDVQREALEDLARRCACACACTRARFSAMRASLRMIHSNARNCIAVSGSSIVASGVVPRAFAARVRAGRLARWQRVDERLARQLPRVRVARRRVVVQAMQVREEDRAGGVARASS